MKIEEIFCNLFGFSKNTFYLWKREKKPIIELVDKYFYKYELEEFLEKESIARLDKIKKFIPTMHGINAIDTVESFREIEADEEMKGAKTVFVDLLNYLDKYENKYNESIEEMIYHYITDNTFVHKNYKIEFIKDNNIDINLLLHFLIDIEYDLIETIDVINKTYNKGHLFDWVTEFIAPLFDMKYNNRLNYYYDEFGEFIFKKYKIEYIEFYDKKNTFSKEMIIDSIYPYIEYIKTRINEKNEDVLKLEALDYIEKIAELEYKRVNIIDRDEIQEIDDKTKEYLNKYNKLVRTRFS